MKRICSLVFLFLSAFMLSFSCSKEASPKLTVTSSRSINIPKDGGTQTISFNCNQNWSVSSSEPWVRVSPSSGTAGSGDVTATITVSPNDTYDARSATITIRVADLSESITISQPMGNGLIVPTKQYDLTNAEQTIEVEVQKNVSYNVTIDDAGKSWIAQTNSKALSTDKLYFKIAANASYDSREGHITIKQTDGNLSEVITVKQSQTNGLFVTTPKYDLSNSAHTLSVEVKANVEFDVTSEAFWISYVETKGLKSSIIMLNVAANETYDNRTGTVQVKQKNGDLTGVITINQKQTDGLFVTPTNFDLTNQAQDIEIEVKKNVTYNIVIPDEAKDWITVKTPANTKALETDKVILSIAANSTYDNREASVTFKLVDGALSETVVIKQSQTNGLFVTTPEYDLSNEQHTLTVEVKTNIEYEVSSQADWITIPTSTKALTSSQITLQVSANETYNDREGKVIVKQKDGDFSGTITIRQDENYGIFVSKEVVSISKDEQTVEVEVQYNVDFDVIIPEDAQGTMIKSIQVENPGVGTKALSTKKYKFGVSENTAYDSRETTITFKEKGGSLSGTFRIIQNQTDGLLLDKTEYNVGHEATPLVIELQTNTILQVIIPDDAKSWIQMLNGPMIRSLKEKGFVLAISSNDTYYPREALLTIKNDDNSINETIKIIQAQTDYFNVNPISFALTKDEQQFTVKATSNIEYEVIIPDEAKSWLSLNNTPQYAIMETLDYQFTVTKNEAYVGREAQIVFKEKDGDSTRTVTIKQEQTDYLKLITEDQNVTYESNDVEIIVASNIDFSLEPLNSFSWASLTGPTVKSTENGITTYSYTLKLQENEICNQRCYSLVLYYRKNNIHQMMWDGINIIQQPQPTIEFEDPEVKKACLASFDFNHDGGLSYKEAAVVTSIDYIVGEGKPYTSFNELKYFTGVTKIPYSAFKNCTSLKSIQFPNSLQEIGESAFEGCLELKTVDIPNSTTKIGYNAFVDCKKLKSAIISSSVSVLIGFSGCEELQNVQIPFGVKIIGKDCFKGCKSLKEITLPNSLTEIGESAFENCTNLPDMDLPDGLKSIKNRAFYACSSLTQVTIPNSVSSLGAWVYAECTSLNKCHIGSGVKDIISYLFFNSTVKEVTIGENVKNIQQNAFNASHYLEKIIIPDSVENMGYRAFYECSRLSDITLGINLKVIGAYAFSFSHPVKITVKAITPPELAFYAFYGWESNPSIDSYAIYVPSESLELYKLTDYWSRYKNIIHPIE